MRRWTTLLLLLPSLSLAGDDAIMELLGTRYGVAPEAFYVRWEGTSMMVRQSRNPGPPWDEMALRWQRWVDLEGGRYAERTDEVGIGYHWERGLADDGEQAWALDHLARTARPTASDAAGRALDLAQYLPPLLVWQMARNPDHWSAHPDGGIRYRPNEDTEWDVGFDPATGQIRVLKSEVTWDGHDEPVPTRLVFEDEGAVDGLRLPRRMTLWVGPEVSMEWELQAMRPWPPEAERFAPPEDFTAIDARPSDLLDWREERVAAGIHRVGDSVWRQMFVEFLEFTVALDACGGDVERRIEAIERIAPGKPVRYVLVNHHHEDHLGGLDEWVREGATVIASPRQQAVIFAHLESEDIDPARVSFQWVDQRYQLSDGLRRLIFEVVPTEHADPYLLAWDSGARVLYAADLWVAHQRAPEVATPNMITLNALIELLAPETEQIVDAHSAIILQRSDLADAVGRAEDEGLGMQRELPKLPRRWR